MMVGDAMKLSDSTRREKLYDLADKDMVYQVWANSFADCRDAFAAFASAQTEDVRNMLYGYADCGRMMQQRLVNLACEHMRFPDEE